MFAPPPLLSPIVDTTLAAPLDQSRLDIAAKQRSSRFPWRGQFSPEFVDYIIDALCPRKSVIMDPFCGSGTVLFEAAQRGHIAVGLEVNPAAWMLSYVAAFTRFDAREQAAIRSEFLALMSARIGAADIFAGSDLFATPLATHRFSGFLADVAELLAKGNSPHHTPASLGRAAKSVCEVLNELGEASGTGVSHLRDARQTELAGGSVDFVFTSPPYVNVFNYHQNYRPGIEALGWQPLDAARSEIGANRKHRGNRFLTVIQYCLDMAECLNEMWRVLAPGGTVVLVVGRTSNVLGCSFKNAGMIEEIATHGGLFELRTKASRSFINRFGEVIYEDVIVMSAKGSAPADTDAARDVGVSALKSAASQVSALNRNLLNEAIGSSGVSASSLLDVSIPPSYSELIGEISVK